MGAHPDSNPRGTEIVLQAWRQKAADAVLGLVALTALASAFGWTLGFAQPGSLGTRLAVGLLYASVVVAAAVARGRDYRVRVWLMLLGLYLPAIQGLLMYDGPMGWVWLMVAPVAALILAGPGAGRVALLISGTLITLHAAGTVTGATARLQVPGFDPGRPSVVLVLTVMWFVTVIPLVWILDRFHLWHVGTLEEALAASARLEEEAKARQAEHQQLVQEAAERERLEREIARVSDEERRRLGHDLHDGASQQLAAALLRCTALEERLVAENPGAAADARALGALLESTMDEVQEVARSLSPVEMSLEALGPALRALTRRAAETFAIRCEFRQNGSVRLRNGEQALHLYRIAQEAVNNAGKHAHAHRIGVGLSAEDGRVVLSIEDDGNGMPDGAQATGLGVHIMTYRTERIGGRLVFEHPAEGGTRVVVDLPRESTTGR